MSHYGAERLGDHARTVAEINHGTLRSATCSLVLV